MIMIIILVGVGGFIGAVLRYAVSGWVHAISRDTSFPSGTLTVNIIGVLGAFTTFSTFGNETLMLTQNTEHTLAIFNVALHVILGLPAVWAGQLLGKWIGG
ncbi:MAG: CrcB family protein [Lentisphaeria bacterium]|nr:CrcB family protein [Candidatus Neomarinimicrobiota bacterium]MCF7841936.1 CrcB family protein [Lentisphaeria bacterium]